MKIRIKGDSVRIRLSRSEVNQLSTDGKIEEKTNFGGSSLVYALQSKEGIENLAASFENNTITMFIPEAIAKEWANNDTVGYSHTMQSTGDAGLFLLLEKDFKCIDADVSEDQSDNFDNPSQSC